MKRLFVETNVFKGLLDGIGDKGLEKRLKDEILKGPDAGDLIVGTGGLRKLRVAKRGQGKSGGYRVIYLDLPGAEVTYLVLIYEKSVLDNISDEVKKQLAQLVKEIKDGHKSK